MQKTAHINIFGTRTFLFHYLGIGFLSSDRKVLSGQTGNNPDEWKNSCLIDNKGGIYIPCSYILAAFREGAVYTKAGRGTIQKKIGAVLLVEPESVYFTDLKMPKDNGIKLNNPSQPVYIDVRAVRNPATKGSNLRYRLAIAKGWKMSFKILWDDTIVSEQQMRNCARDAGMLAGIGDGRKIGFGRFSVESFDIAK